MKKETKNFCHQPHHSDYDPIIVTVAALLKNKNMKKSSHLLDKLTESVIHSVKSDKRNQMRHNTGRTWCRPFAYSMSWPSQSGCHEVKVNCVTGTVTQVFFNVSLVADVCMFYIHCWPVLSWRLGRWKRQLSMHRHSPTTHSFHDACHWPWGVSVSLRKR